MLAIVIDYASCRVVTGLLVAGSDETSWQGAVAINNRSRRYAADAIDEYE